MGMFTVEGNWNKYRTDVEFIVNRNQVSFCNKRERRTIRNSQFTLTWKKYFYQVIENIRFRLHVFYVNLKNSNKVLIQNTSFAILYFPLKRRCWRHEHEKQ